MTMHETASTISLRDLVAQFNWERVTGDDTTLERLLETAATNRPGLELSGYFPNTAAKRLAILGDKEIGYIEQEMDEVSQRRSFEFITGEDTPAIVICHGHECPPILAEIALRKNFPIFRTPVETAHTIVNVTNFLDEKLAHSIIIHGELMRIHGVGVMITGNSGMAKGGVIACLLPATSFNLGAVFAPARDMVNAGVPVAMATDFNPGSCPCLNMQFVINLGCLKYKLTPEEVLTAVTLNGAAAIDCADKVGSVEVGKQGDLVIWDAPDLDYICYRVGSNLVKSVIKGGKLV